MMMVHNVVVMVVVMVMLHRSGFSGQRRGRDASGQRNGEQDLLQHRSTLGFENAPHQRGMEALLPKPS
jgi:hypothetical protein